MGRCTFRSLDTSCRRHSCVRVIILTTSVCLLLLVLAWRSNLRPNVEGEEKEVRLEPTIYSTRKSTMGVTRNNLTTHESTEPEQTKQVKRVAIVIVSSKRSGSSFLGDIFNHHPSIFYIYEPLFQLSSYYIRRSAKLSESNYTALAIARINSSLYCSLDDPYADRPSTAANLCERNALLKKRKLCHSTKKNAVHEWERACAKQDVVAVKLIRLQDIADLEPLSHSLDLRVIHLVRDPRPTERSRKGTGHNADLIRRKGKTALDEADLCEHMQRNFQYSTNPPTWLRGRYLLIRFEDLAQSPISKTREILNFVGYDVHDDVTRWLRESTSGTQRGGKTVNRYSTNRNSSDVIDTWRRDMTWTMVENIQKVCEEPIKSLGYVLLHNEAALRNVSIKTTIKLQVTAGP
ncbi:putative carbohydrate sulfotransferase 1-like [Apostichopus japonicus]|uniref:Putative carbohydrate sulfotransferase 1-like n=1 Tax=Stichopus japonicus TaxID=307972 RepID=A0A2G8LA11_STIJA|nr:putative carbohydrate sulfotransferase 1-like [Apostichopus japonicus]